jgi:hypothetical protein
MTRFIRPSTLRRYAKRRNRPVGPHAPATTLSLTVRQDLAHIDWPVVLTTGVFSLLLTMSLTVTAYFASNAAASGNKRLAKLRSSQSLKAHSAGVISSVPLAVATASPQPNAPLLVATTEQRQPSWVLIHEQNASSLNSPEATVNQVGTLRYPEENQTAMMVAAARAPKTAENLENLTHSIPAPEYPPSSILKPEVSATSEPAQASGSCAGDYGTNVKFVKDPEEASKLARQDKKLVFLLHVSGNFEDAKST